MGSKAVSCDVEKVDIEERRRSGLRLLACGNQNRSSDSSGHALNMVTMPLVVCVPPGPISPIAYLRKSV